MKKATMIVIEAFPMLEKQLHEDPADTLNADPTDRYATTKATFLKLIRFFEKPDEQSFDLGDIHLYLSGDWVKLALDAIHLFFTGDSYPVNVKTHSIIKEAEYLNQKEFVEFLNEHGESYSEAKMSVYIQRNKIPEPDLVFSEKRYWLKSTCEKYLISLRG